MLARYYDENYDKQPNAAFNPRGPTSARQLELTASIPCSLHVGTCASAPVIRFGAEIAMMRDFPCVK